MNTTKILKAVDSLDHVERWRYMIALGARSVAEPALAKSLFELAGSPVHYERSLAWMSARGSCDEQMVTLALADPSSFGGRGAVKLAVKELSDDRLVALVARLPKCRRLMALKALQAARRFEVCDQLYALLGEQERRVVLPFTSQACVQANLNREQVESMAPSQWSRLAHRFPDWSVALLQEALSCAAQPSWVVQQAVGAALYRLRATSPKAGLALLTSAAPRIPYWDVHMCSYAWLFPQDVAALRLAHPGGRKIGLPASVCRRLESQTLCALAEKGIFPNLASVFPKLFPAQREALYRAKGQAWRTDSGALPLGYVKSLATAAQRRAQALHAFNAPLLASQPSSRVPYLAVLPFEEACVLAEPFLSQPEGDLRALAVRTLVECGRYHVSDLGAILDFCLKRENEQDPVRQAMLQALSSLPPTRWQAGNLPKIKLIIAQALRARDCSIQSMTAAAHMLLGMIVSQTDFVLAELPVLVERMGRLNLSPQASRINDKQMLRLAPALMPLLTTWVARNHSSYALELINCFGCRAKMVPEFGALMVALTRDSRAQVARSGLSSLIRLEFFAQLRALIPQLIEQDESWILECSVSEHLHRKRQSLLTPFLTHRLYKGRFNSAQAATLPTFNKGFERWTAEQQGIYAKSLQSIFNTPQRNAWELYQAISAMAAMPSIDVDFLVRRAHVDGADVALRDRALDALGRADAGRGVPALLDALDDERARVAIYALRRALLQMPESAALALLAKVSSHKVSVLKEVIRLVGEFPSQAAYAFLQRFAEDEALHPDAQIALLRAFWSHLDHDEVWTRLHAAARSERAALARSTIRIPQEGLSPKAREELATQMTLLLEHPDAQVQRETLQWLIGMPLSASAQSKADATLQAALTRLLIDIDPRVCQLAALALLATYMGKHDDKLVEIFGHKTQARSLVAVVNAYVLRRRTNLAALRGSVPALLEALLLKRWQPAQAVRLALFLLEPKEALAFVLRVEQAGLLHAGVVEMALKSWEELAKGCAESQLASIEIELRTATSAGLRRIGLGLLCELGKLHGWSQARHASLQTYQADEDLWVADAAVLIEPPKPCAEIEV